MGLSQIFTVTQPLGGISAVSVSSVSLYFQAISNTMGIDVQIREVANGMPNYKVVENSRVTVRPTDKYSNGSSILTVSNNGIAESKFNFLKPVQLNSLSQYALMVLPHASDPGYVCWGALPNRKDQTSSVAITFNGAVGPLITWDIGADKTVITNQALKFSINKAISETIRYHDDSFNFNEESIVVNEFTKPFTIGEPCYMTQSDLRFCRCDLFSTNGTFITGEEIYQIGSELRGNIYYANSSSLLLNDVNGVVSNAYPIYGSLSGAFAWITVVNNSVVCSTTSNTISFPFTGNGAASLFYANQSICLTSSDLTKVQPFIITSVQNDNKSIRVSWNPAFNDSNCSASWLRGDKLALRMNYQGYDSIKQNHFVAIFNNSTANTQISQYFHFANSVGQYIIGQSSRARCKSYGTIDLEYHNVVPQFHFDQTEENKHVIYWGGYKSYSTFTSQYPAVWRYITER
jgi:hypothetical protein